MKSQTKQTKEHILMLPSNNPKNKDFAIVQVVLTPLDYSILPLSP
jgi:hypothetical protein